MKNRETTDNFQYLYKKYRALVCKLAYDATQDYHLAEDICQETFLKLYAYRDCLEEARVKPWLLVVAANLVRDHFRKGGKYQEILGNEEEAAADPSLQENCIDAYLDQLGQKELRNRVLEGLRQKNPDWYEVFILAEYLGIPRKRIAARRGIALSTVDAYIKKSRKWMRQQYKKDYEQL